MTNSRHLGAALLIGLVSVAQAAPWPREPDTKHGETYLGEHGGVHSYAKREGIISTSIGDLAIMKLMLYWRTMNPLTGNRGNWADSTMHTGHDCSKPGSIYEMETGEDGYPTGLIIGGDITRKESIGYALWEAACK